MSYKPKKHDSFIIHDDQAGLILSLPKEERGELITALIQHHLGIDAISLNPMTQACYQIITNQMDREEENWNEMCERQRQKGKKSALAKQQNNQRSTLVEPQLNNSSTYKDKDNDNEKDKDNDNEKDNVIEIKEKVKKEKFKKPSIEDIEAYRLEIGGTVDAQHFYDYYESNGWKINRNPMKDWKATYRNWMRRNKTTNRVDIVDSFV